jgi:hypothetical protein
MIRLGFKPISPPPKQFEQCQHCAGALLQVESFLHAPSGKTIRAFRCTDCKKLTWDD